MKTDWYPGTVAPVHRGAYERDWRDTNLLPIKDRRIHLDFFEPVTSTSGSLYPGVWYTIPDANDCSQQKLPWRGLTKKVWYDE